MNMHVSSEELERLRQGRLLPAEIAEIARHAAVCEACRNAVGESYGVERRIRSLLDVEHLPEEVLMAHADGLLPADEHLDACDRCRADVEEFRRLRPFVRRRRNWVIYAMAASIAAVALVLWSLASRPDRVVPTPRKAPPISVPVIATASYEREDWEREVADVRRRRAILPPTVITQWQTRKGRLRGASADDEIRLTPNRLVVFSSRPLLRWTPRSGATYKVIMRSGSEITESAILTKAEWSPSTDLRRGAEYLWQLEITTSTGRSIYPRPPNPPARFRVLDDRAWTEISEARRRHPQDTLLHAIVLARYGLKDEALEALEQLRRTDASLADALRASLQKW